MAALLSDAVELIKAAIANLGVVELFRTGKEVYPGSVSQNTEGVSRNSAGPARQVAGLLMS